MMRRGLYLTRRSVVQRAMLSSATRRLLFREAAAGHMILTNRSLSATSPQFLPSHQLIELPALSPTMETGTIKQWEISVGGEVEEGDVLCEVETDKAVVAFEAVGIEGFLAKIITPDGTKDIKVGDLVCIVVEEEKDVAAFANYKVGDSASTPLITMPPPAPAPAAPSPAAAGKYPPYEVVTLPALSPTMEAGAIVAWEIRVGDEIIDGESAIAEIETDKATITFEATGMEGFVAKLLRNEGDKDIKLGEPLLILVEDASMIEKFSDFTIDAIAAAPAAPTGIPPPQAAAAAPAPVAALVASPTAQTGDRVFISPFAKKIATEQGIEISQLAGSGTGPSGRVRADDVRNFKPAAAPVAAAAGAPAASAAAAASTGEYTDIDLTNMRKTIAKRLLESKNSIPHYYLTRTIRMNNIINLRKELNSFSDTKISINDFIIKAASLALMKVPEANSAWMGESIRQYNVVDMSVAVATPNGLITPIIFDSHTKGLSQISKDMKELAAKARDGKLQPHEFVGGTFTISNLGMMGIDHFTAIINPPQSCILAVGASTDRLVLDSENERGFSVVTEMKVTMSCDHRTVDGAVGAQWLKEFTAFLENPITMHL